MMTYQDAHRENLLGATGGSADNALDPKNVLGPIAGDLGADSLKTSTGKMFLDLKCQTRSSGSLERMLMDLIRELSILGWRDRSLRGQSEMRELGQHIERNDLLRQSLCDQINAPRRGVPEKMRSPIKVPDQVWVESH